MSGKFKELLRKIQGLKIAIYEKELAEQKAELEYTQEQIKPHFFLNCLSLIHGIADKNNEGEIVEITTVLSDYMRYIFQDSKKQRDVEEELEHIEAYIRIQKLRYGEEAFSFEATTDGDIGEWKVPSLLLQTLVENSVVHGVSLDRKSEISYISQTRRTRTVSTSTSVFPTPETDFRKRHWMQSKTTRLSSTTAVTMSASQYKTPPGADVRRTGEHYVLQYG